MPDLEKVIEGLRHCTAWAGLHECQPKIGPDCPYEDEADCKLALMHDALYLLKEREAVKPIFRENPYTHLPVSYCPKCREPINQFIVGNPYREVKYCHYCGQKVKWAESSRTK